MIFWETPMWHRCAQVRTPLKPTLLAPAFLALTALAGCQSQARQDPYVTPTSTCSYMLPTVSGERTYAPGKTAAENQKGIPDSAIAYADPESPAFCDRPLSDTLPTAIEMANYVHGLNTTGLFGTIQQSGPYTVFGIPNAVLENYQTPTGSKLNAPENAALLRDILSYSIVKGEWSVDQLRVAAQASPTHSVGLPTLNGRILSAWVDQPTGQIILGNGAGMTTRLWVTGIPQSNGRLYFTQSLLLPPANDPPLTIAKRATQAVRADTPKGIPAPVAVTPVVPQPIPGHRATGGANPLATPPVLQNSATR
ncbi:fasciclin domain-containing protein [Acetobacter malorum]|uniref:fasciclin domain-containing protein n=1 Tax=Acetobacter malorum TaxID=178901 RepID=UPI0039E775A4